MSLPVLDAATLIDGNATSQNQLQLDLLQSLQSHGFVKFINHGFDPNYVDELMEWVGAYCPLLQMKIEIITKNCKSPRAVASSN